MMNANNRAAYATRIEQSNQYLQMNEMRFGNIVQLVIQQAPNTPRLTVERLVIKYDKKDFSGNEYLKYYLKEPVLMST